MQYSFYSELLWLPLGFPKNSNNNFPKQQQQLPPNSSNNPSKKHPAINLIEETEDLYKESNGRRHWKMERH